MFKVDVRNLVRNKFQIANILHISPNEIDKMTYWEYEYFMDDLREYLKEEEKRNKQQSDSLSEQTGNLRSNFNNYKTPKIPKFSSSNFKIPKLK